MVCSVLNRKVRMQLPLQRLQAGLGEPGLEVRRGDGALAPTRGDS